MTAALTVTDEPEVREIEALVTRFRRMRPEIRLLLLVALIDEVFGSAFDTRVTRTMH